MVKLITIGPFNKRRPKTVMVIKMPERIFLETFILRKGFSINSHMIFPPSNGGIGNKLLIAIVRLSRKKINRSELKSVTKKRNRYSPSLPSKFGLIMRSLNELISKAVNSFSRAMALLFMILIVCSLVKNMNWCERQVKMNTFAN
jgi:hypothetical protein